MQIFAQKTPPTLRSPPPSSNLDSDLTTRVQDFACQSSGFDTVDFNLDVAASASERWLKIIVETGAAQTARPETHRSHGQDHNCRGGRKPQEYFPTATDGWNKMPNSSGDLAAIHEAQLTTGGVSSWDTMDTFCRNTPLDPPT